jgi:acyl dehydratase
VWVEGDAGNVPQRRSPAQGGKYRGGEAAGVGEAMQTPPAEAGSSCMHCNSASAEGTGANSNLSARGADRRLPSPTMSLEDVVGSTFGPYPVTISAEKVAEYVAATGDIADRWQEHAPPGYAGALLFVAAPHFLDDPRVRPFTSVLVHVDQTFTWHAPLAIGTQAVVTGTVEKVRERGSAYFVTFNAAVESTDGDRLLDAVATFLMGKGTAPPTDADPAEPPVSLRGRNDAPSARNSAEVGDSIVLAKSASRIDLVRYAGASGDFNPIHFDHEAARNAGLDGIVVHGLLMSAWGLQAAAMLSTRPDPVAYAKIRFRNPLYPAAPATVIARVGDEASDGGDSQVGVKIMSGETQLVGATCIARLDG